MSLINKLFGSKTSEENITLPFIENDIDKSDAAIKADPLTVYNKRIELNPHNFDALYFRGNEKSKMADYTGAIEDYTKTLKLNPKFTDAYFNRAIAKRNLRTCEGHFKITH